MRNEERSNVKPGQAEQISGEGTLELPETEKKNFKFKSVFAGGFKKFGARNLVIVLAVLLIVAAVYVNWRIFGTGDKIDEPASNPGTEAPADVASADYFSSAELTRKQARDEAMEVLQGVVDNNSSLEEAKKQALEDIAAMASNMELEANIEALIKAKGFNDCVAVINGDKANIVVKSEGLKPNQLSQILEIVYLQANIVPGNVTINEK